MGNNNRINVKIKQSINVIKSTNERLSASSGLDLFALQLCCIKFISIIKVKFGSMLKDNNANSLTEHFIKFHLHL